MAVALTRGRFWPLLLAVALDAALGEPPNRYHPVAWLGSLLDQASRRLPVNPPAMGIAAGVLLLGTGVAAAGVAGFGVAAAARGRPGLASTLVEAVALKPTFAWRALDAAVGRVGHALAQGDLESARRQLGALVSRPTGDLTAAQLASAAVESAAENFTDSIVAPLLAYATAGLPGAAAYRAVNTLDAMVGYHGHFEYLGKPSARLDDLLNFVPARLAGLLICAVAPVGSGDAVRAFQALRRDGGRTESPNAGWPMAAMAGALGTRLEKPGHYVLNDGAPPPGPWEVARAARILRGGTALAVALAATVVQIRRAT